MENGVPDRIRIRMGDITELQVDAIVNAANPTLLGGGGVDGMIHWSAGSGLLEECRSLGGCPTGEARITGGHRLPARYIIHTVGPVYAIDGESSPPLLASCYRKCLEIAAEKGLSTIAFPAISCGSYGYPVEKACRIAIDTVIDFLENNHSIEMVTFILFSCRHYDIYMQYMSEVKERESSR